MNKNVQMLGGFLLLIGLLAIPVEAQTKAGCDPAPAIVTAANALLRTQDRLDQSQICYIDLNRWQALLRQLNLSDEDFEQKPRVIGGIKLDPELCKACPGFVLDQSPTVYLAGNVGWYWWDPNKEPAMAKVWLYEAAGVLARFRTYLKTHDPAAAYQREVEVMERLRPIDSELNNDLRLIGLANDRLKWARCRAAKAKGQSCTEPVKIFSAGRIFM